VAALVGEAIPDKTSNVLLVGCGNSDLGPSMQVCVLHISVYIQCEDFAKLTLPMVMGPSMQAKGGYTSLLNTDYSLTVIKAMKERFPECRWAEADMLKLGTTFPHESFDFILDKVRALHISVYIQSLYISTQVLEYMFSVKISLHTVTDMKK
jgi:hypothetical protein